MFLDRRGRARRGDVRPVRRQPDHRADPSIGAGADLTVVLCSNPSTGFSWGEPQVVDASVIRLADRTYQATGATTLPIVGAAGAEVLTVHGVTAGTTTLTISYGQPWAGGVQGEWVYRLTVTVG